MPIPWENVFSMAAVAAVVTFLLLVGYRLVKKELSLSDCIGLALICGVGFIAWFAIFNGFSLSGLDRDLPIPLFPISPEDMGCGITVLLLTFLFGLFVSVSNKKTAEKGWQRFGALAWFLPALVALVIDVYFI